MHEEGPVETPALLAWPQSRSWSSFEQDAKLVDATDLVPEIALGGGACSFTSCGWDQENRVTRQMRSATEGESSERGALIDSSVKAILNPARN